MPTPLCFWRIMLAIDKFESKIKVGNNGCIVWPNKNPEGYSYIWVNKRAIGAHRFIWEFINGAIPEGLEIDHTCMNRSCVNIDHLDIVTHSENMKRCKKAKNVCKYGHTKDGLTKHGIYCKQCKVRNQVNYRSRKKQSQPTLGGLCLQATSK